MCQVYSALKLLFYVSKVLGFAPYTLLENGILVPSCAAKTYSIFLCICVIAYNMDVFEIIKAKDTPIFFTGIVLIFSCSWVTRVLAVVISILSHTNFQKITHKFNTLDSMLHQTLHDHKKQFYTVLAQLAVGFISSLSVLFWYSFYVDNNSDNFFDVALKLANIPVQFIWAFSDFIIVIQYTNFVLFTGQHFSHINIQFAELVHYVHKVHQLHVFPPQQHFVLSLQSLLRNRSVFSY